MNFKVVFISLYYIDVSIKIKTRALLAPPLPSSPLLSPPRPSSPLLSPPQTSSDLLIYYLLLLLNFFYNKIVDS